MTFPLHALTRLSARFWLVMFAAGVAVTVTLSMGRWQLARAAYKELLQGRIAEKSQLPALTGSSVLTGMPAPVAHVGEDKLLDRMLSLSGRWLPEHTLLLDNRPMNNRQGFYVLTPLQDSATGQVVMVQRGWVQRDFNDREHVPAFETPAGVVRVLGRIAHGPSQTLALSGSSQGDTGSIQAQGAHRIRQNLNLSVYREETRLPLWDHLLLQTDAAAEGLQRDWPLPNAGVEKHYGYAFQWFGLSALIAVLYVWFQLVPLFRAKSKAE